MIILTDKSTTGSLRVINRLDTKSSRFTFFIQDTQYSCDSVVCLEEILRERGIEYFQMGGDIFQIV